MPRIKPKTAPNVPAKTPSAAERAEQQMRQRLAADPAPIDYKTGRLKSGAKLGPLWLRARRSSGSLGPVVEDDPCTTGSTDLDDYYMFHQEFAVFHPCVTHPQFRQPGDLKCPKCLQAGVLQGNGLRQGTRCVLLLDGQQKVFSQGMTHKNCRGHNGKDYTFSSWDLTWLEVNFKPALLTTLPYIILTGNTVVSRSLLEFINSLRVNGMSFEAIVKSRNKTLAHKAVRLLKLCLQFQADKVAAQCLTPFGRAGSMAAAGPAPVPAQGPTAPGSSGQLGASSSSSGRQAGSRQPPAPKQSTLQSIWGRAGQLLQTLSPSKGSRANQEPSTQQQPQQQQEEEPEQQQQQCSSRGVQQPLADTQQPSTAEQEGSQQSGLKQPRGPWDPEGFGWRQLDSKFAAKVFNCTGDERRLLQARMMESEPAGGHVSLDHVHQTAKRMQGGFIGMVIAMSASGTVLGFWNVYSTSLRDIEPQLTALDQRQRVQHDQGITIVTVDNPHTVEALLKKVLPNAEVKMDAGHFLFSRLGKRLDKLHALYGEALKALAMCLFDFNKEDLQAACNYMRSLKEEWRHKSNEALVRLLPLSTWKRIVRRVYLPAEVQSERLNKWIETYITNETAYIDTSVAGQARPLVRGGAEGKKKFDKMFDDQMKLVHKGSLSDPPCVAMYVEIGKNKAGLTLWRCLRGSSKNEAANLVIERSLHTTAKMTQLTATGIASDRFAIFNHDVKLTQHKAQLKLQGQWSDVAHFDHSYDFVTQLQVNSLCQQLGLTQPYPFLDPSLLGVAAADSRGAQQQTASPEQDAGDADAEQQEGVGAADWDEDILLGAASDEEEEEEEGQVGQQDGAAAAAAAAQDAVQEQAAAPATASDAGMAPTAVEPAQEQQQVQQGVPRSSVRSTPKRRLTAAPSSPQVSPRARLARAAAAGVAALVAREAEGDSDQEDAQPPSKRRKAADSGSYTAGEEGTDEEMEDVQSPPQQQLQRKQSKQQQQQQQTPTWVSERVATRLAADHPVGEVQGEEEEQLFMQLLPRFAGSNSRSSSNSPLRVAAASVDFTGMADAWNAQVPDLRRAGRALTYKQVSLLKAHFTKVSREFRGPLARQQAQAGAAAAAAAAAAAVGGYGAAAATAAAAGGSEGAAATTAGGSEGAAAAAAAAAGGSGGAAAAAAAGGCGDAAAAAAGGSGGAAAAAAAAGGDSGSAQQAWQGVFARRSGAGGSSGGSRQQPAKGTGKGGAGASNKCVPCTLQKMQQLMAAGQLPADQPLTAAAAKEYVGFVQATPSHHNQCPFCKCKDCQRFYIKRGTLDPSKFTLRRNCQGMKKKK